MAPNRSRLKLGVKCDGIYQDPVYSINELKAI